MRLKHLTLAERGGGGAADEIGGSTSLDLPVLDSPPEVGGRCVEVGRASEKEARCVEIGKASDEEGRSVEVGRDPEETERSRVEHVLQVRLFFSAVD